MLCAGDTENKNNRNFTLSRHPFLPAAGFAPFGCTSLTTAVGPLQDGRLEAEASVFMAQG